MPQADLESFSGTSEFPNAFEDRISITYNRGKVQAVGTRLVDNAGRSYYCINTNLAAGNNITPITDIQRLPSGAYTIELQSGTAVISNRIVK